ncbi:uncharacterized protein LOC141811086 [Halichoeres trimaculatus]|uniref:uncharacterized protein LOC141811086 n=1 Tax=Halichoeres trimaculatus TaxID=147232 RepID=UPI003D9DF6BC
MEYHSGGSLPLLGRPRYCPGANANGGYLCETGHCCGETGCCTYYYELWWFWLLWTVLILFSCCCAYRHRRAKLRVQQQQRQREISLLAYHGANSYPSSMLDLSFLASLKLPSYEEVAAQPSTPPPPYSSVFTTPRYPQPPRTSDPHLLMQHGPLLHQTLSDGPSSLSSDNSSSCSCDSCCPSSPCSSSLSAPVTYETDTSHATTPSEAAPFTLDVTMETIAAAANCLEVNQTRFESERTVAAVAIDISDETASGAQEPIAMDSSVPNQTVTVALVTKAVPPHPLSSPGSETVPPVESSSPIKLDLAPCTQIVSTCSSSTLPSPGVDLTPSSNQTTTQTTNSLKTTLMTDPSTPTAHSPDIPSATQTLRIPDLTRTFDTGPSSLTPDPSPDGERMSTLIADPSGPPTLDPNPSLGVSAAPPDLTLTPTPQPPNATPSNLTQASSPAPTDVTQPSSTMHSDLNQAPEAVPTKFTQDPDSPSPNFSQASAPLPAKLAQDPDPVLSELIPVSALVTQAPDAITENTKLVSTNLTPSPDQPLKTVTQALDLVPPNPTLVPNSQPQIPVVLDCEPNPVLTPDPSESNVTLATDAAQTSLTFAYCQISELSPGPSPALGITSPSSDLPHLPEPVAVIGSLVDPAASSGSSLVLPLPSGSDLVSHSPSNIQAGLSAGSGSCFTVGSLSSPPSSNVPVLTFLTQEASSSSCPAITVESEFSFDPPMIGSPSFPSPRSLPSPSSCSSTPVLSPSFNPAPALLLDPLTALHSSNRGGSSSGHASSLSPSPRATQSPPKQTLFSPCVDIFEPGPPSWADGEEQDHENNYDEEDEDMGADESQYRHRRLTGDSGIEVCRCRMEEGDEEEEDEEEKRTEDGRRGGGGERDKKVSGNTNLHDSVDCPARSQITTEEGLLLCNTTSTTTPPSDDSSKVIVMETV